MLKVLHVFDHSIPLHSGYTFRSRAILREQRALGITTCHVTSPKQGTTRLPEETIEGLIFYRSAVPTGIAASLPIVNQWAVVASLKSRLREVVKQEQPDIIHAHSPALNGFAAVQIGKEFNIPVVYEIRAFWEDAAVDHGTCKEGDLRYRLTRALENHVIKHASAVTTICKGLQEDLILRGISKNKLTEIPNAVEVEKFTGKELDPDDVLKLRKLHKLEKKFVLGFVGSFYAYEGIDTLLDALPSIIEKQPNVAVLLVGGGPQETNLKQKVINLGLEAHVIFTGRVPHDDVALYYDMIDLLVFPRKSMRLTELVTPLKPLEAMAQHKLVLASDVGGHKELIEHKRTGYLFKANDINALSEAVHSIILQENHDEIKTNGFSFVKQVRNWHVSVNNYLPLYNSLTS